MSDKIYRVFISSTYDDLKTERQHLVEAILGLSNLPVGMEWFGAGDEAQWKVIQDLIDVCDYYVVLVAHRYGSVTPEGISFTQKEYEYAVSKGIPTLRFVVGKEVAWPPHYIESDSGKKGQLEAFKKQLWDCGKNVATWLSPSDLAWRFTQAFQKIVKSHPRSGLVPFSSAPGPEVLAEMSRLSAENASLKAEIEASFRLDYERANRMLLRHSHQVGHLKLAHESDTVENISYTGLEMFYFISSHLLAGCTIAEAIKVYSSAFSLRNVQDDGSGYEDIQLPGTVVKGMLANLVFSGLAAVTDPCAAKAGDEQIWYLTPEGKHAGSLSPLWVHDPEMFVETLRLGIESGEGNKKWDGQNASL